MRFNGKLSPINKLFNQMMDVQEISALESTKPQAVKKKYPIYSGLSDEMVQYWIDTVIRMKRNEL